YELALGLAVLGAVMTSGTLSTTAMIDGQYGFWNIVPQLLGFVIFMISATAEVVRAPFDLVEAEQELVGGYNTEYGSMKFALFFMAEYVKLIAMNAIAVTLFLGGWNFPGLEVGGSLMMFLNNTLGSTVGTAIFGLLTLGSFMLKVFALSFVSVWIRATVPRTRYDQLMNLGWKYLLPLGLLNVAVTAVINVAFPDNRLLVAAIGFVVGLLVVLATASRTRSSRPQSKVTLVRNVG
ncbi:MAG: NADH-quinone oxidoreductase subunit H, partial [Roseiflexaceae bacterium]|nr:NADH-quinone oxidoreductase subunit H [Roseiflexaceae bacterium]